MKTRIFHILLVAFVLLSCLCGCHAERWPLWKSYSNLFLDPQGRVIDHQAGDRTTSEGQSYAMFFALVANDRGTFDRLLKWTENNLAGGDLTSRLPAWSWGRAGDGQWRVLDSNSASDADLWTAYSLLEAGRLWQQPHYTALGKVLAARIAAEEIADLPGFGPMLIPGQTGFHPDANTWILNPSYPPLPLIIHLAGLDPQGPWAKVAANMPRFIAQSANHGFAMDWVSYRAAEGFRPCAAPGQASAVAVGSYDAIRVYLWAGMTSPSTPGRSEILHSLSGMSSWLGPHLLPPEKVNADGTVISPEGPIGFSAALVPFLEATGAHGALEEQEARLTARKDPSTGLLGSDPAYYDQNLGLFGEGWAARRFSFGPDGELAVKWKR